MMVEVVLMLVAMGVSSIGDDVCGGGDGGVFC